MKARATLRRACAIAAWNAGFVLAGIVLLELLFGGWLDSFRAPALWRLSIYRDVVWTMPVAELYDGRTAATYRRDSFGLRGSYGTPEAANLLAIGGSTTDERFVSEGETWVDVLADCLSNAGQPARIANAGVSGQSSRGHIRNFDQWLAYVPGLRPKYILIYLGVNESLPDERLTNDDLQIFNESSNPLWLERLKLNSAVYALYQIMKGNLVAYRAGIHHVAASAGAGIQAARRIDIAYEKQRDNSVAAGSDEYGQRLAAARAARYSEVQLYRGRLVQLSGVIERFGSTAIFVTQTEGAFRLSEGRIAGEIDRYFALQAINEVTLAHCKASGKICIDLANLLRVENGDFYDAVHTTPKGSRKVGRMICDRLLADPNFTLGTG